MFFDREKPRGALKTRAPGASAAPLEGSAKKSNNM